MRLRFFLPLLALLPAAMHSPAEAQRKTYPYQDRRVAVERRAADLLARMTTAEKAAQLRCILPSGDWRDYLGAEGLGGAGPILRPFEARRAAMLADSIQEYAMSRSRLGIPVLIHDESLHGLVGNNATCFPQAIGLAATWDTALVGRVAAAIGRETRARGIRQVLAPVINIARDARWGRVEETYGEDPYLTARMGVAYCRAIEREGVIATPKHFAANVGDGGRDSWPIHFNERLLREMYFPAFEACIREAGAGSVMAAYNSLDGLACSANPWLLTGILRKEWSFKGFVVSDYGSVHGIMSMHHNAATPEETAALAIGAGLDMELPHVSIYGKPLTAAIASGALSKNALDAAAKNVLRAKFRLGLFDDPLVDPAAAEKTNRAPEHLELAREAAAKSLVLLKNENNLLPLGADIRSIALIGPAADTLLTGGYSGWGFERVSLKKALEQYFRAAAPGDRPRTAIRYAKGCDIGLGALVPIPPAFLSPAKGQPGGRGLRGEYFSNMELRGEPSIVRVDSQVNFPWGAGSPDPRIPADKFSVRWSGAFTPPASGVYTLGVNSDDGVRLFIDGKTVIDSWVDRGMTLDAIAMKLEGGRSYDMRIEYYENLGWAHMSLLWDYQPDIDERLSAAVAAARSSDAVILALSIVEGEGSDRASLDLPGLQEKLIRAVADAGKPTIAVLCGGGAVTMKNWEDRVPAILEAWYPGEMGNGEIARALFGEVNPGGKLPITFPAAIGQVPLYYNHKPTGRGNDYAGQSGKPRFPFGHGLSYTTFEYSNLRLSAAKMPADGKTTVTFDIRNAGSREGDEVAQLYIHDLVASRAQPVLALKAFRRLTLAPGEKRTLSFEISREQLSMLDANLKRIVEPGEFDVMIGSSSADIRLSARLEVTK